MNADQIYDINWRWNQFGVTNVHACKLTFHWYMPARVSDKCGRSEYGKGRWAEECLMEGGKQVPFVGSESIAAVSSKCFSLTKQGKLPKHLWASVAESTCRGQRVKVTTMKRRRKRRRRTW